jgi:hypothetical protein
MTAKRSPTKAITTRSDLNRNRNMRGTVVVGVMGGVLRAVLTKTQAQRTASPSRR